MRRAILAVLLLTYLVLIVAQPVMMGWDWREYFYPALRLLLAGESPYQPLPYYTPGDSVPHQIYHPPWLLVPLAPVALLPVHIGELLMLFLAYAATCVTVAALHDSNLSLFFILSNPLLIQGCLTGNVDSFVTLGLITSPRAGLYLLSLKPQLGWGAIVYLIWSAYREHGVRAVISLTWPMALIAALSFMPPFGFWPAKMLLATEQATNASLPFGVGMAVGMALLLWGLARQNLSAAFAGGFISAPYHAAHSWYLLLILIRPAKVQFAFWLVAWGVVIWWELNS